MVFDVIPTNGETWLVCGGRDFADKAMFDNAMGDLIHMKGCPRAIIHGGAPGADSLAHLWAARHGTTGIAFPADWNKHGKAAGPIRNQEMIDHGKPNLVVAFPGGRGTADMVQKAKTAGIDVAEIKPVL